MAQTLDVVLSPPAETEHTAGIVNGLLGGIASLGEEVAQLQQTIKGRAVIEQAKGMLMLSFRISDEASFTMLSRLSQNLCVELPLIAETIVKNDGLLDRQPDARAAELRPAPHRHKRTSSLLR